MKLQELYDVLDNDGPVSIVQHVAGKKDYEVYCGLVTDFPYHLMRDYGSHNVLMVEHTTDVYLPQENIIVHGIRVFIKPNKEDDE